MTPLSHWRLACKTGLRFVSATARSGDALIVGGRRKGFLSDPILDALETPITSGYALWEYDLSAGHGGNAVAVTGVEADEIRTLCTVGTYVYAGGCAVAGTPATGALRSISGGSDSTWAGSSTEPLSGAGGLWIRKPDGTWDGGTLWTDGARIQSIRQIVLFDGCLWLSADNGLWLVTAGGDLQYDGAPVRDLWVANGHLCASSDADGGVYVRRLGSDQWTNLYVAPDGYVERVLGDPHLGATYAPDERDTSVSSSAGVYAPWLLTHEIKRVGGRLMWVERDTPLSQEDMRCLTNVYRLPKVGVAEKRTPSPLYPDLGLRLATEAMAALGERLFIPEATPCADTVNARLHVWPWSDAALSLPPMSEDLFPRSYTGYDAYTTVQLPVPETTQHGTDQVPWGTSYVLEEIDSLMQTWQVTSLSRSSGRLYAGVADRLYADVVPFSYVYPWPSFLEWFQLKTGTDPDDLYTYLHLPFADYTKVNTTLLANDIKDLGVAHYFFQTDLTPWGSGFDWGACPSYPTRVIDTDDTRAWVFEVSQHVFRRVVQWGDRYVACSGTHGWLMWWDPSGAMQEWTDLGAACTDATVFGDELFVVCGGQIRSAVSAHAAFAEVDAGDGFSFEALAEFSGALYAIAPGETTTEVWTTSDGSSWSLLATLSGVLRTPCVHGTDLWLFGEGAGAVVINSGTPTGASVSVGSLTSSSSVVSATSAGGVLWIGTEADGLHGYSGGSWAEVTAVTVASGQAVTALGWFDGSLWVGLDDTQGTVQHLFAVDFPCGDGWYCAGDEGSRTVQRFTPTSGITGPAPSAVSIAHSTESIARLALLATPDGSSNPPKVWFSAPMVAHLAETTIPADALPEGTPTWALAGRTVGRPIMPNQFGVTDLPATSSLVLHVGGDAHLLYNASDWLGFVNAFDGAIPGRQRPDHTYFYPVLISQVLARLPEKTQGASFEVWVTTDPTSVDLDDYQPVTPGRPVRLSFPSYDVVGGFVTATPAVRFALRFYTGDSTAGLAAHVTTEVV